MPINNTFKKNEDDVNTSAGNTFSLVLNKLIAAWDKFIALLFSKPVMFSEFLEESGTFFDKQILETEKQEELKYIDGTLVMIMKTPRVVNIKAKLYYLKNNNKSIITQELTNSVITSHFKDWDTSYELKELRKNGKMEFPISAPER